MESNKQIIFEPFPKQQEFLDAVLSGKYSFVLYGGSIRGGKTYTLLALFILLCKVFPGSRWAIVRKDLATIKKNLYPSWDKIKPESFIKFHNKSDTHICQFKNGSEIIFFPESYDTDKDLNRWKGLEVNGFGFEEINECQIVSFYKAFERAGSYIIPRCNIQPKPLVVATCNPTQGWVKELVYNPWQKGELKENWLYIPSKIYDNKPLLEAQPDYLPSLKANLNRYEYEVFVEGNWDVQLKTGNEFFSSFEPNKHLKPIEFNRNELIHISIDSNVFPYIAVSLYQLQKEGEKWLIKQVEELPCVDPNNTARLAGETTAKWLINNGYNLNRVCLYGDRSTKNRNNIDDNKRSFFEIFTDALKKSQFSIDDKFLKLAPSPSLIADFVNAIFDERVVGRILIGENCKKSINDFIETKTDKDGNILKTKVKDAQTGISYEPHGHLVDNFKDFLVQCFYTDFQNFNNRFKLKAGQVEQVNRGNNITF